MKIKVWGFYHDTTLGCGWPYGSPKAFIQKYNLQIGWKRVLEFGQKDLYICTQGPVQENDCFSVTGHNDWSLALWCAMGGKTINTLLSILDVINNYKGPSRWCGQTSSNIFMEWMHQNPHEKCCLRSVICRHGYWPFFVLHVVQGYPIIRAGVN